MTKTYSLHIATILASTEARSRWNIGEAEAERAIRAARRQVQRYGDEARDGLLSWCITDEERTIVARALGSARVATIVKEWTARG